MYRIDSRSAVPVYEQLKRQIRLHIISRSLTTDEKLPSIRELASGLRVNPNTVVKAYSQLETEGYIRSRAGSGYFVDVDKSRIQKDTVDLFDILTDEYISQAIELGYDSEGIINVLSDRLKGDRQ